MQLDNITIYFLVVVSGAIAGIIIPYVLKVLEDPEIKFDALFFYMLLINIVISAVALLPDNVPELTFKVLMTAFVAGFGLQAILNKIVSQISYKSTPTGE